MRSIFSAEVDKAFQHIARLQRLSAVDTDGKVQTLGGVDWLKQEAQFKVTAPWLEKLSVRTYKKRKRYADKTQGLPVVIGLDHYQNTDLNNIWLSYSMTPQVDAFMYADVFVVYVITERHSCWKGKQVGVDEYSNPIFAPTIRQETIDTFSVVVRHISETLAPKQLSAHANPFMVYVNDLANIDYWSESCSIWATKNLPNAYHIKPPESLLWQLFSRLDYQVSRWKRVENNLKPELVEKLIQVKEYLQDSDYEGYWSGFGDPPYVTKPASAKNVVEPEELLTFEHYDAITNKPMIGDLVITFTNGYRIGIVTKVGKSNVRIAFATIAESRYWKFCTRTWDFSKTSQYGNVYARKVIVNWDRLPTTKKAEVQNV